MFGFLKNKNKNTYELALQIDSRSIGVFIFEVNEKGEYKIVYDKRNIKIEGEGFTPLEMMLKNILLDIKNHIHSPLQIIHIILEYPWVKENYFTVRELRGAPFRINNDIIADFIKREQDGTQESGMHEYFAHLIEKILLDGQKIQSITSHKAKSIEVYGIKYEIDRSVNQEAKNMTKDIFPMAETTIYAGPHIVRFLEIQKNTKSSINIMLGTNHTDIWSIEKGMLKTKITIPYGYHHFIKNLMHELNSSSGEAEKWLELYNQNILNEEEQFRISNCIKKSMSELIFRMESLPDDLKENMLKNELNISGLYPLWSNIFRQSIGNKAILKTANTKPKNIYSMYEKIIGYL